MRLFARRRSFWPILFVAGQLSAAEPSPDFASRLAPIPACEGLVVAARTHRIPLHPIEGPIEGNGLNPGDSLSAVVTFREKSDRRTQWLLNLRVVVPDPQEQPDETPTPMIIYTSTGNKLEFSSSPAFVNLRTLGPFAESEIIKIVAAEQLKECS